MSTTTTPAAAPSLSASICAIVDLLLGGENTGALAVTGKTASGVDPGLTTHVRAEQHRSGSGFMPESLLTALEDRMWSLHLGAAVRPSLNSLELARISVLPVTWPLEQHHHHSRWQINTAQLAEARSRIEAFGVAPAAVVFGAWPVAGLAFRLVGLYALATPIRRESEALNLLRELSAALGAAVPAEDANLLDLTIPVPGSVCRVGPGLDRVQVLALDANQRHTHADIAAAIAASTKAPARRRQETHAS
ncbi:MAG: hypothetical protein Q8L86_03050 [Vicinamibacterales bacterium]|nr:hypothetical protein [Vicinamibacterales bacterium]